MKLDDPIVDRSPAQKLAHIDKMRRELFELGFSVVTTAWLHSVLDRGPPVRLMDAAE